MEDSRLGVDRSKITSMMISAAYNTTMDMIQTVRNFSQTSGATESSRIAISTNKLRCQLRATFLLLSNLPKCEADILTAELLQQKDKQ